MSGDRVGEDRQAFEAEPMFELYEIGPDDELDEYDLAGIADADAGRTVSHEIVMAWLEDYAKGIKRPAPRSGK